MTDIWADASAYASYQGEGTHDDPPAPRVVCADCGEDHPPTTCWCDLCGGTEFEEMTR